MSRKQADTIDTIEIVTNPEFARGLAEVRAGCRLIQTRNSWDYERGRCFGFIAPLGMPLCIGGRLNPQALKLADAAFSRKQLI